MEKQQTIPSVSVEHITQSILILRGQKVMLDAHLAAMYGVETKVLLQAVKRNLERFPADFMLQLSADEWSSLRSQFVTLKTGRGQHRKYLPYVFTEQGVAMQNPASVPSASSSCRIKRNHESGRTTDHLAGVNRANRRLS